MSYSRISAIARWDTASDFNTLGSPARSYSKEYTSTANVMPASQFLCATAGTTVELGNFTTCSFTMIKNLDATNYVTVVYRTGAGAATNQTMKLTAGQFAVLCDITPGSDLTITANTASVTVEVFVAGT